MLLKDREPASKQVPGLIYLHLAAQIAPRLVLGDLYTSIFYLVDLCIVVGFHSLGLNMCQDELLEVCGLALIYIIKSDQIY